jgi:hypothetical protein
MATTPEQVVLARIMGDLEAIDSEMNQERTRFNAFLKHKEEDRVRLLAFKEYLEKSLPAEAVEEEKEEEGQAQQEGPAATTGIMWAVTALQQFWHPADTNLLLAKMQEIGFRPRAANPYTSLFSTLRRVAQRPDSQIVKREGLWGLRGWPEEVWAQGERSPSRHEIDVEALNAALESEG